ncbi:MAG: BREX system ATP-binding protein BrxD [Vulcanimicrobiota bacterium]
MLASLSRDTATSIINALRSGTVPFDGLEHYAVGLERQMEVLREQREYVAGGHSAYKCIRGAYGSGKTFLSSLAAAEAADAKFLTSKVVISAADTPLHKLKEVYRRFCQNLSLADRRGGALQTLVDRWLYRLEDQVIEVDGVAEDDPDFAEVVARKVDMSLVRIGERAGRLAVTLKAYHKAKYDSRFSDARGLLDWVSGEPKVGADVKRLASVTGQIDNTDALVFLRGWLELAEAAGYAGVLLVLDEVETILRLRRPERLKSLEVLRQLIDAVENQELPGLHLLITGTPDFFESSQGVPSLVPLHERIRQTHRDGEPENFRQPQITLPTLDAERLRQVATRVRAIYPAEHGERLSKRVPDSYVLQLVDQMTAGFGGRIEVLPRLFLREFVHILDLVDQHSDYDPAQAYRFDVAGLSELRPEEEEAIQAAGREVLI